MASKYPDAEIIGIDLAPTQRPFHMKGNVTFRLADFNQDWDFPDDHFDLVHFRCLAGTAEDWPGIYAEAYRCLKPGGWIEHTEIDLAVHAIKGRHVVPLPDDSAWDDWMMMLVETGKTTGRPFGLVGRHGIFNRIRGAGFIGAKERRQDLPIGRWAKEPRGKGLGARNEIIMKTGVEGFMLFGLKTILGSDDCDVDEVVGRVRQAVMRADFSLFQKM